MSEDGYFLLSAVATNQEANQLKSRNQGLLRSHRGRLYISGKNLEQLRQKQPKQDQDSRIQEDSQYKPIDQLAETQKEYNQLMHAARKGRLRLVKQGRNWLATQEEVDKFREQNESPKKPGRKATSRETIIFDSAKSV